LKGCARQAEWVFDSVLAHPSPVPILVPVPVRSVPSFALMPSPAPPPLTSLPYPPLPPSLLGFRSYFLQGPLEVSEYPVALPEAVLGRKGASRGRVKRLVRHSYVLASFSFGTAVGRLIEWGRLDTVWWHTEHDTQGHRSSGCVCRAGSSGPVGSGCL
jgi:hypothetical protein